MALTFDEAMVVLKRLERALLARLPDIKFYDDYYSCNHPVPSGDKRLVRAYRELLKKSRSNWMELVVDAVGERLEVQGFRMGRDELEGDQEAWAIWQENGLDPDSEIVHTESLIAGVSYVLVWADPANNDRPLITPEHASQAIVEVDPANRRLRTAGLKRWLDDDGFTRANVYLPDEVWKFRSSGKTTSTMDTSTATVSTVSSNWVALDNGEPNPMRNPLNAVPLVPFRNKPRLLIGGRSELHGVTHIQDRINSTLFDRLLAQKFGAFRQRWVTGYSIEVDDETGQPQAPFDVAQDRVLIAEDADTKFGEFSESDLRGYIGAVEADIQHLAAITRTPPHYLLGQSGAFPSGQSLKATETGLVAKVKRRMKHFGEPWTDVIRLSFAVLDDPKQNAMDAQTVWADPESRTEGELVDALTKMKTLGVPDEVLWEKWGASPQEIERWKKLGEEADTTTALLNVLSGQAAPAPPMSPRLVAPGSPAPASLPAPPPVNGR